MSYRSTGGAKTEPSLIMSCARHSSARWTGEMLERAVLLLLPWLLDATNPAQQVWLRQVLDGATAEPLGLVRWACKRRAWLAWFRPYRLEVLETEDAALLLTLVRSWSWLKLWDVY